MANFKQAFDKLMNDEGLYNPDDCGADAYRGINRGSFKFWSGWKIIDTLRNSNSFPSILEDNKALQEMVSYFYKYEFWDKLRCDELNSQKTAETVFNFAVNSGLKGTVLLLQKCIGVEQDAVVGVKTITTLNSINENEFSKDFFIEKVKKYAIIAQDDQKRKYFYSWIRRAIDYI
jgi:lysozyme family protein